MSSTSHQKTKTTKSQEHDASSAGRAETIREFKDELNMSAAELEKWLATPESRSVGQKTSEKSESTGHESGRHIVQILHKKPADYTDDDLAQMHRVISYVRRHRAQGPEKEVETSPWRYSLKNWGFDPCKKG